MGAWIGPADAKRQTGGRRHKQKTGRNCLGPVADSNGVAAEPLERPAYKDYTNGRMAAGLSTMGECSQMPPPAPPFSKI
jgi:hypothetical protein